jgi:hypothetical protein
MMQQLYSLIIGISLLALGIPLGDILAKVTKEELKSGKKYFKILISICLIGGIIFLILENDALLFAFLFIAIVTSRSLKK